MYYDENRTCKIYYGIESKDKKTRWKNSQQKNLLKRLKIIQDE